ncbi:TPA: hypothetical protein SAN82_002415 [Pseudomonas putida]|nr:hypothetical protein [Pseudomonas putida]
MSTPSTPLYFPEALQSPGRWTELGKAHGLNERDFEWFSHLKLASHASRNQQTPPMLAEKILVTTGTLTVPLAGCFVLSTTPDDKGEILYTPYAGIKKFDSRTALSEHLNKQLDSAGEDHDLLAFMSLSARKTLAEATDIRLTFETIEGEIFEDQRSVIENNQRSNDQAVVDELKKLPALNVLLDTVLDGLLKADFPGLDQRRTQVSFYAGKQMTHSMTLTEALLWYYRHQRWPVGQRVEFAHPQRQALNDDQQRWEVAIKNAAEDLTSRLSSQLQLYWNEASVDGATRRVFLASAVLEKARADLLLKREAEIITAEQSRALGSLIKPPTGSPTTLTLETIRLWEHEPNYVELAGSLMISQGSSNAFLYTPANGLQVLMDYLDLKATLRKKSMVAGHDDELYDLMSLEERDLFIGFDEPQVSGAVISGSVFTTLFEAIITKQQQNLEYAFQVFRRSDGTVNIQAYCDKALDIRSLISEKLLVLETDGRWSTRPVLSGEQPSMVLGDTAAAYAKTYRTVESEIREEFELQPLDNLAKQRSHLTTMSPRLSHALCVGVRGEAELRELSGTLRNADWVIVDAVFNPDRTNRADRRAVRGFKPDAFSLVLDCSGEKQVMHLANCVLLTERGGLDVHHSGHAILWTPGAGLEVFTTVASARQQLNLRLLDPEKRLVLLENLSPTQRKHHRRYSLNTLQLIEGSVSRHIMETGVALFLARCEHVRSLKMAEAKQTAALEKLKKTVIDTNLSRAARIAEAISRRQSLPSWLGMAPVEEQKLHIELLEQYRNSVTDDQDYLHGMQTLEEYVRQTLKTLLATRFPNLSIDPDRIEITPNLALAGPAQSLTRFALNHINIAQGTGFRVSGMAPDKLPQGLDQTAVTQLLLSLNIQQNYGNYITQALTGTAAAPRRLRFVKQVPWQLLQHAHALKLQQHLSPAAFDLILQVLDMPDAVARSTVPGAHAIVRSLELIKTSGATAARATGIYLIGPGTGKQGPYILFTPYSTDSLFTEFSKETDLVAAINTPGALQDLILRRLPEVEQATFRNLLKSSAGAVSEITLGSTPIGGNLLTQLFKDKVTLLPQMLGSKSQTSAQSDWDAVTQLFNTGIKLISSHLPGKLSHFRYLHQAYEDFKDSAEALQGQHWSNGLRAFINGAAQMISLGELELEASDVPEPITSNDTQVTQPVGAQQWSEVETTSLQRTRLQHYESTSVQLKDLKKNSTNGTFLDEASTLLYAPIAGKVYPVKEIRGEWRMIKNTEEGPRLLATSDKQLVIDPQDRGFRYGKALSKMHNKFVASHEARRAMNIEARGMTEIRAKFPRKADMLVSAVEMARFYALNSLHNLVQLRALNSGTRLDNFLKEFFDVSQVDASLLDKIKQTIVPVCNALVDPENDLLSDDRLVVGSNKKISSDVIAFTNTDDPLKRVHFSEYFFDPQLEWYKDSLIEPFDVDTHSQAASIIHELAHQATKALDFVYVEARRPFTDLVETLTGEGQAMKNELIALQRNALSLRTPRERLFSLEHKDQSIWISFDSIPNAYDEAEAIFEITGTSTMEKARDAFLSVQNAEHRINVILRNADSVARLICEMGRQLDPVQSANQLTP